jgi:hypothetical protein
VLPSLLVMLGDPDNRFDLDRLDTMLRAIKIVQPDLQKFYGSLTDEQKERFNRLAPVQG